MGLRLNRRTLLGSVVAASTVSSRFAVAAESIAIVGAGSSYVNEVIQRWIELTPDSLGVSVTYDPIGSGNGRTKVLAGDVDFAGSDQPLSDASAVSAHMIQFPMAFGAVVLVVNLPDITNNKLILNGEILAGIYSGAIKNWNDPKIAALNPDLKLPNLGVHPLSQGTPNGGSSGTTYIFTQYLLATNPSWREKFGPAVTKRWAVGSMVATSDLMVENMKILPGAIGYMPLVDARRSHLPMAMLKNKAGHAVAAAADALRGAIAQVNWAKTPNMVATWIDLPGEETWPIVISTYAIIPVVAKSPARGAAVRAFFQNVLINSESSTGQRSAVERNAVFLPASARTAVKALLDQTGH